MPALTPIAPQERISSLDVLRGLALWGVLLGNAFHLFSGHWAEHASPSGALDYAAEWFGAIVVQSKAQTLLTFLFGFGFAMQLLRARQRGANAMPIYVRRLLALLLFGMLHLTLLWWGDVMWTYALAGFVLLPFVGLSTRTQLLVALALSIASAVLWTDAITAVIQPALVPMALRHAQTAELAQLIAHGSYLSLVPAQLAYAPVYVGASWPGYLAWVVSRFLLGSFVGARRWFDRDGAEHLRMFRRLAVWGAILALPGIALGTLEVFDLVQGIGDTVIGQIADGLAFETEMLGMVASCIGCVVLLMQRPRARRVLLLLAPAGRMPLTVYIAESMVCTFLFYGWGLGWVGRVTPIGSLGIAFALYPALVALCHLWLRYFRFGPLDWVWRSLVYLRWQPMRAELSTTVRA